VKERLAYRFVAVTDFLDWPQCWAICWSSLCDGLLDQWYSSASFCLSVSLHSVNTSFCVVYYIIVILYYYYILFHVVKTFVETRPHKKRDTWE